MVLPVGLPTTSARLDRAIRDWRTGASELGALMKLSKRKAAKRLLCSGIKLMLSGEDELAVHVIVSSASKLCLDLFEKQFPGLSLADTYIVPEHKNDWYALMRRNYNFLKHADRDHDETADIENIRVQNAFELVSAYWHFSLLFPEEKSGWFIVLFTYVALKYPSWIKIDSMKDDQKWTIEKAKLLIGSQDPDQRFKELMDTFVTHPLELSRFAKTLGMEFSHQNEWT
jgi:hypothetical protein